MSKGDIVGLVANVAIAFAIWVILYFGNYRPYSLGITGTRHGDRLLMNMIKAEAVYVLSFVGTVAFAIALHVFYSEASVASKGPTRYDLLLLGLILCLVMAMVSALMRSRFKRHYERDHVVEFEG